MKFWIAAMASLAVVGCAKNRVENQAEEVREKAEELSEESEEQLEEQIDVAEAREELAQELRRMSEILGDYRENAESVEAMALISELQQRYDELAARLDTVGPDPDALRELQDLIGEFERDLLLVGGSLGT